MNFNAVLQHLMAMKQAQGGQPSLPQNPMSFHMGMGGQGSNPNNFLMQIMSRLRGGQMHGMGGMPGVPGMGTPPNGQGNPGQMNFRGLFGR